MICEDKMEGNLNTWDFSRKEKIICENNHNFIVVGQRESRFGNKTAVVMCSKCGREKEVSI
jgi:RNase P subunit RPR2